MRYFFLCLLAALTVGSTYGETGSPVIHVFQRAQFGVDGLGWSATQLDDGRLVFGFDEVSLFDGVGWKTLTVPKTYALRALTPAPDGGFWVGGVDEVGRFEQTRSGFHYHSLTSALPPEIRDQIGDVWHVFSEGETGAVFVSTAWVLRWDGKKFETFHLPGAPRLAAFRRDGKIYIGHRPSGLLLLEKDLKPVLSADDLKGAGVVWAGDIAGRRVYATTSGLRAESPNGLIPFLPELDRWIQDSVLTCATSLQAGGAAIGTLKGGVICINGAGEISQRLDLNENFPTQAVHGLFEDREGWLWVISPARLLRVLPTPAVSLFSPPSWADFPASGISALGDGALVASETALWKTLPGPGNDGKWLSSVPGIRERMLSLLADGDGVLVAHRGGVSRVQSDGSVKLMAAVPVDVFAVARDSKNRLFAALNARVVEITSHGLNEIRGTLPDVPNGLAAISDETLIVPTMSHGLVTVGASEKTAEQFCQVFANESGPSYCAVKDALVAAVRGSKLAVVLKSGGTIQSFNLPPGFEPRGLEIDSSLRAWLIGERRFENGTRLPLIYRISLQAQSLTVQPIRLDTLNSIGPIRAIAVHQDPSGLVLWLAGDTGILRVLESSLLPWTAPASPVLYPSGDYTMDNKALRLVHRAGPLEIEILAREPDRRTELRLQTSIEESESAWSEPEDQEGLTLANLRSGVHHLRARFMAADGSVSPTAELSINVALPPWFTPSAIAAEALLLILAIFAFVKLWLRRLQARAAKLEKLVKDRTIQLAHASQAKSDFVSVMSHELRNPLNGIVASAHALEESGVSENQRSLLATVRHCSGLLEALIGDVLDLAEIEAGTMKLRNRPYQPREIVETVVRTYRMIPEQKGLRLTLHVAPEVPLEGRGDANRIQQVLLNLISNAIKFSDQGEILLGLAPGRENGAATLNFFVQDEGPGISPSEQPHLFEKFSRLPKARDNGVPGTGLGLALCRQLVERMGGRIWLANTNRGARFEFWVPLDVSGPSSAAVAKASAIRIPKSALIVEDLDYNARAMVALLKQMGCEAEIATTGTEAMEKLRQKHYEVAFLDCDLPDIKGDELAAKIVRELKSSRQIPLLIASTAYADAVTQERCRQAGMTGFISKPITPEKLRAAFHATEEMFLSAAPVQIAQPATPPSLTLSQIQLLGSSPIELETTIRRLEGMLKADIDLLRAACERADFKSAGSTAHRIISHAHFVNARQLAMLAAEIERCAIEEPEMATELVAAAESEASTVIHELTAVLRAHKHSAASSLLKPSV